MLDFTASNTDGISGISVLEVQNGKQYEQLFTGESSRFSVIKNTDQAFNWSVPSSVNLSGADFTVEATASSVESVNISSDFHDKYNTTSKVDAGSATVETLTISTDPVTNLEKTSVTLNGSVTLSPNLSGTAFFNWAEQGNSIDSNATSFQQVQQSTSFTASISGIESNTTHKYRAIFQADGGVTISGQIK
jgi:hypothetical protein